MTPGPFEYFSQNQGSSENQFFLNEGVKGHQRVLGGVLVGRYLGYMLVPFLGECNTLEGSGGASSPNVPFFQIFVKFFWPPQISEFWLINWHRCVTICNLKYRIFLNFFSQVRCLSYGCSSNWPFFARQTNHLFTAWRVDNFDAMSFGNLEGTFLPTKSHFLRICVINTFLINGEDVKIMEKIFSMGCHTSCAWVVRSKLIWVVNLMFV